MERNKSENRKFIGYCRVSTDNQREEGTIEIQENALREFSKAHRYNLVKVFRDEGISGGLENRPGLSQLFDDLENDIGNYGVLVYKLDRLARDLYIQEHLIKKLDELGIKLFSIKEPNLDSNDPMRKAFRQFMGIVSELEKAFITMRLSGGRINKARKGKYAGGSAAYGYRVKNKELVIDEEQAETVKTIFKLKKSKKLSLHKIAKRFNDQGIPTSRGGKWYARTVKNILENPIYKGNLEYNGIKAKRKDLALV